MKGLVSMARTNLAYDLSRFDESAARKREQPKKAPQIKKVEKTARRTSPAKLIALIALIAALAGSIIYSQVVLTELGDEAIALTNQLNILKSENTRKSAELDAKTSLKNIEEYAQTELGYIKLDQSKIEYVSLSQDNQVQIKKQSGNSVLSAVKNFFDSIVAYFN